MARSLPTSRRRSTVVQHCAPLQSGCDNHQAFQTVIRLSTGDASNQCSIVECYGALSKHCNALCCRAADMCSDVCIDMCIDVCVDVCIRTLSLAFPHPVLSTNPHCSVRHWARSSARSSQLSLPVSEVPPTKTFFSSLRVCGYMFC